MKEDDERGHKRGREGIPSTQLRYRKERNAWIVTKEDEKGVKRTKTFRVDGEGSPAKAAAKHEAIQYLGA